MVAATLKSIYLVRKRFFLGGQTYRRLSDYKIAVIPHRDKSGRANHVLGECNQMFVMVAIALDPTEGLSHPPQPPKLTARLELNS